MTANRKYQALVMESRELFWKHGFRRVTIEEICHRAKVSKMTFYRYFPNKLEIAKEVFRAEAEQGVERFRRIIRNDTASPEQKIHDILLLKSDSTNEISKEYINDFYRGPSDLTRFIQEITVHAWNDMIEDFRKAQTDKVFRSDFKPEAILILAQKIGELMNDPRLTQLYVSPQEMVMELAVFFTYGISGHGTESVTRNAETSTGVDKHRMKASR